MFIVEAHIYNKKELDYMYTTKEIYSTFNQKDALSFMRKLTRKKGRNPRRSYRTKRIECYKVGNLKTILGFYI